MDESGPNPAQNDRDRLPRERYVVATFADQRRAGEAVNALRMAGLPVGQVAQDTGRGRAVSARGEMQDATRVPRTIGTRGVLATAVLGAVIGAVVLSALAAGITAAIMAGSDGAVVELTVYAAIAGAVAGATVGWLGGTGVGSMLRKQGPALDSKIGDARGQLQAERGALVAFHSDDVALLERAERILVERRPLRLDVDDDLPHQVRATR